MGQLSHNNFLDSINCKTNDLQNLAILKLLTLFEDIENCNLKCTEGFGVRGKYIDIENNQLELVFTYNFFIFEFYLSFDQLEYYIFKNGKKLKECNLDDFWKEQEHVNRFIAYLKKDMKSLNIPFNDI